MIVFLIAAVVICGFGWFLQSVAVRALILYMLGKGYTLPTKEESKACCDVVVRRMFGLDA